MAIAIGGAGGGSGLGPAQRGPAAPQGAGQSREPWAMSPCLLGVPRSLGTEHPASSRGNVPTQPLAPAHPTATRREKTPSPGKSPSSSAPSSSTPSPMGTPKGTPKGHLCPAKLPQHPSTREELPPRPFSPASSQFFFFGSN